MQIPRRGTCQNWRLKTGLHKQGVSKHAMTICLSSLCTTYIQLIKEEHSFCVCFVNMQWMNNDESRYVHFGKNIDISGCLSCKIAISVTLLIFIAEKCVVVLLNMNDQSLYGMIKTDKDLLQMCLFLTGVKTFIRVSSDFAACDMDQACSVINNT
jgi:hypothetical protein